MSLNVVLGPTAKVDLGPTLIPFRVMSGRLSDKADVNETSDSESASTVSLVALTGPQVAKEFNQAGMIAVQIELEMQLDLDTITAATTGMFITPLSLQPGNRIPMNIWPEGRVGRNSNWKFYQVIVEGMQGAFVIRGSNPQAATITLRSTGYYKRPYETDLGGVTANVTTR